MDHRVVRSVLSMDCGGDEVWCTVHVVYSGLYTLYIVYTVYTVYIVHPVLCYPYYPISIALHPIHSIYSHFLYIYTTYRDNPETTGWREILEMRTESPVLFRMGEMVREYFYGKLIKEADLDPDDTVSRRYGVCVCVFVWKE